ncbi:MAG: hypothetical protein DRR00_06115 [Candidatus Parabeggiatoa sp. nov. 3]|nr:MAG: hypothetical protein DRR00_06115 [Gammaproteobacteria bacterium]RKZ57477.1 MAG: hypothetical protein DRQ99_26905 [Gammaproteobacteria bacterium]
MINLSENKYSQQLKLRYEKTSALYASQFVITANGDEVIVNFSSGSLPDSANGDSILPIHTRIALTANGAKKLANLINQALSANIATQGMNEAKSHTLN